MEHKLTSAVQRPASTEDGRSRVQSQAAVCDVTAQTSGSSSPRSKAPLNGDGGSRFQPLIPSNNLEIDRRGPESKEVSTIQNPPLFPQLSNNSPTSPKPALNRAPSDGEDEEPAIAKSFQRSSSPSSAMHRSKNIVYQKVGEEGVCKMHKFSLWETASRFYLVGGDIVDRRFRILKIDRTVELGDLSIAEDDIVYTKKEMNRLLNTVDDGNKSSGGLKLRCSTWGLLGFIRFTGAYYMLIITKRRQVAMIGGHYIYQVDGTDLVSLTMTTSSSRIKVERDPEEARFIGILHNLDLSRSFYFSYSYDITRSLQHNILHEREVLHSSRTAPSRQPQNAMFIWNYHLLEPASRSLKNIHDWCLPIVHGFVDQARLSIYGRAVYITIIARRSRFFAGARFLKRGANDLGYVANDVETEQIVSEMLTTSFHAPGPELFANQNYTSYVQHRGSIPLYWTQDNTGVSPKPDIEMNLVDPFYSAAALHFDDLFERYGAPIYVLNLVKARERTPRESILLKEFSNAIIYLNQFLPEGKKIIYKAWDMSRASKRATYLNGSRDQDVIGTLESIAEDVMKSTGFFQNGNAHSPELKLQNGVARTNCIDCLDRTNAAQFVIGKCALGYQLHALGVIDGTSIDYDTDAVNLFTHMYHDHGDTIAIQYGGSHLVNTMATYRKINQWTSHPRDMVESFKRYYNNSFLDRQRQEAYNLFLGNYVFAQGQPMLWDLSTDYYLHHADPRTWSNMKRKSYVNWFTPGHLKQREMPEVQHDRGPFSGNPLHFYDDYWLEYYRPLALSSFNKIFAYKMNSTLQYIPIKSTQEGKYDLSPFRVRSGNEHESPEKGRSRKGVTIVDPQRELKREESIHPNHDIPQSQGTPLPAWLQSRFHEPTPSEQSFLNDVSHEFHSFSYSTPTTTLKMDKALKDKSAITQWTLNQFVANSLNPSVAGSEAHEYQRYINHPLNLPLVVSAEIPPNSNMELLGYINSNSLDAVMGMNSTEDDIADYTEYLDVGDEPLTVAEADPPKKRYKAYRQWLKGKSLFKQQRLDP